MRALKWSKVGFSGLKYLFGTVVLIGEWGI